MSGNRSSVLFDLFATSQRVRSLLEAALAGCGLRADEYAAYSALFEFGPMPPTEMARTLGMPPTTVSHFIRDMRERGHLDEERNPRDGRSRLLSLSPAGKAAHRRANADFEQAYQRFLRHLPDRARAAATLGEIERAAEEALRDLGASARPRAG